MVDNSIIKKINKINSSNMSVSEVLSRVLDEIVFINDIESNDQLDLVFDITEAISALIDKMRVLYSSLDYMLSQFVKCGTSKERKYRYKNIERLTRTIEKIRNYAEALDNGEYYDIYYYAYHMAIPFREIMQDEKLSNLDYNSVKVTKDVNRLYQKLYGNASDIQENYYIYVCFEDYLSRRETTDLLNVKLAEIGIRTNNYKGDPKYAVYIYENMKINTSSDLEVFRHLVQCKNNTATSYMDLYRFDDALHVLQETRDMLENFRSSYNLAEAELSELNRIHGEVCNAYAIDKAIKLSIIGTKAEQTKARKEIMELLELVESEFKGYPNNLRILCNRTMLYAISAEDRELYETYAKKSFGIKDWNYDISLKEIKSITNGFKDSNSRIEDLYKLFRLLKSVVVFYSENIESGLINNLENFINYIEEEDNNINLNAKPYNHIYKYCAKLFYIYADNSVNEDVEYLMSRSLDCVFDGRVNIDDELNISMLSTYAAMYDFNIMKKANKKNKELYEVVLKRAKIAGWKELIKVLEDKKSLSGFVSFEKC